jgi:hypothetical protein
MNRTVGRSTTLAALLVLSLVGCGGGGGSTGTPEVTKGTVAPAPPPAAPAPAAPPAGKAEEEAAPLLAWADGSPEEGKAPLNVEFKADVEGGTPPLKYTWQFGDGSPSVSEANPKHTYEKPGKYRADLSVSDSAGDSDSDYIEIEVQ